MDRLLLLVPIAALLAAEGSAQAPETFVTKTGVRMATLAGGTFRMGSDEGRGDEAPAHAVTLDPFHIDVFEVTQRLYDQLMQDNPSHFEGSKNPVETVDWASAARFCNARSQAEGLEPCYDENSFECDFEADGYRLPTEAEWEYACRAGTDTAYYFGADPEALGEHAWFAGNADETTHAVGEKPPNPWGLYDMLGNVAEWCNDLYDPRYYESSPEANPRGPDGATDSILRGGSWTSPADECRAAYRLGDDPGGQDACFRGEHIGFRCVRRVPQD